MPVRRRPGGEPPAPPGRRAGRANPRRGPAIRPSRVPTHPCGRKAMAPRSQTYIYIYGFPSASASSSGTDPPTAKNYNFCHRLNAPVRWGLSKRRRRSGGPDTNKPAGPNAAAKSSLREGRRASDGALPEPQTCDFSQGVRTSRTPCEISHADPACEISCAPFLLSFFRDA